MMSVFEFRPHCGEAGDTQRPTTGPAIFAFRSKAHNSVVSGALKDDGDFQRVTSHLALLQNTQRSSQSLDTSLNHSQTPTRILNRKLSLGGRRHRPPGGRLPHDTQKAGVFFSSSFLSLSLSLLNPLLSQARSTTACSCASRPRCSTSSTSRASARHQRPIPLKAPLGFERRVDESREALEGTIEEWWTEKV